MHIVNVRIILICVYSAFILIYIEHNGFSAVWGFDVILQSYVIYIIRCHVLYKPGERLGYCLKVVEKDIGL